MGCGCNKNKIQSDAQVNTANNEPTPKTFRSVVNDAPKSESLLNKMSMVKSFASAITSRGLNDRKATAPIKQLRVLSCFGNMDKGGELPPCEHLRQSSTPGKHFCGGCGCGDKPHTWLMAQNEEYSKLDYPRLNCPLNMPGFTNYQPSAPDEANEPITRRYYIENIDFGAILQTPVTNPDPKLPEQNDNPPVQTTNPESQQ